MTEEALFARAAELGVQTDYHDVQGGHHRADPAALAHVVAMLEADREAAAAVPRVGPPLHLHGPLVIDAEVTSATIGLAGTPHPVEMHLDRGRSQIVLPDGLPDGCHVLEYDTDRGPGETVVVVAPPRMPRSERFAGQGGLFVPTYALWEADRPLPSFRHLHDLARTLERSGVAVVSTLPLYATFLDQPFDPSPYSPISRLHWNEIYLDDDCLPDAPVPDQGSVVDWRTLARRRRDQLVEAARSADTELMSQLSTFVAANPDVGAYARFLAAREAGGDEMV